MRSSKWNRLRMGEFLEQLGLFLKQGYPIDAGIHLLTTFYPKEIQVQLSSLISKLREGSAIHEGLLELKFPREIISYLYFSEKNGELANGLIEGGRMLIKQEELKRKFQKLMRYPIFILWLVVLMAVFLFTFLLPQFQLLYDSMNVELPLVTILFLNFIKMTPLFLIIVSISVLTMIGYYLFSYRKYESTKKILLMVRIPVFSKFVKLYLTHYFSLQLGRLLRGGLSIYDSLSLFEKQNHLAFFNEEGKRMKLQLQRGEKLEDIVKDRPYFQKELPTIITHGQSNGTLTNDLHHYSDVLFVRLEERAKRVLMIVQPTFFFLIGIVVMFMFLSIMLPIFQLISSL